MPHTTTGAVSLTPARLTVLTLRTAPVQIASVVTQVIPEQPIPGPLPIELWRICRAIIAQPNQLFYFETLNNIVDELVRAGTPESVVVAFLPPPCQEAIRPIIT